MQIGLLCEVYAVSKLMLDGSPMSSIHTCHCKLDTKTGNTYTDQEAVYNN